MIRAVIIEDSRLARVELREQLRQFPQIIIAGEAESYEMAIKIVQDESPDLIFLDIHLPGKNGFEILQELDSVPAVIFTTAFDQYALQSFEYNAIDYLLKPISKERLAKSIVKAESILAKGIAQSPVLKASSRIFVKDGRNCWFVTIQKISKLESMGNYTRIFFDQHAPLVLKSLQRLEQILDPELFIRVNRQQIVNVNYIDKVADWFGGKLRLTMNSGDVLEVSRRQVSKIKEIFGL